MNLVWKTAAVTLALAVSAAAQSSTAMSLRSQVPGVPCATGGLWGLDANHILVGRRSRGFAVIDISDPDNPVESHVHPPSYPRTDIRSYGCAEIKSDGRFIYVSNEDFFQGNTGGFFIYDSQPNPMNPTLVLDHRPAEIAGGVHNMWLEGTTLYCVSDTTGRIEVYDISTRTAPVRIATLGNGIANANAHDVIVKGGRAYCSLLTGGFAIYDVTNPAAPVLLGQRTYANPFTHNAWPTEDQQFLYTTDENLVAGVGGSVRIWDISNLSNIQQVGNYKAGATASIVHNVIVVDKLLYVSYYKEGVRVLSLQPDPANPVEIAHFDTFPAGQPACFPNSNYAGCWGVWPLNSKVLAATDLDNGTFLLRLHPVDQTLVATPNPVTGGQNLNVTLTYTNNSVGVIDAAGILVATNLAGIQISTVLAINSATLASGASSAASWNFPVPPGLPPGLTLEVTGISGLAGARHSVLSNRSSVPIVLQ